MLHTDLNKRIQTAQDNKTTADKLMREVLNEVESQIVKMEYSYTQYTTFINDDLTALTTRYRATFDFWYSIWSEDKRVTRDNTNYIKFKGASVGDAIEILKEITFQELDNQILEAHYRRRTRPRTVSYNTYEKALEEIEDLKAELEEYNKIKEAILCKSTK